MPKLVRALGEPATRPPDVVVPPMPPRATVVDLVRNAAARAVEQIITHDPGARLGDDPEDVHKLRVATRRLRSDLHSFSAVLDPAQTDTIRSELGWLGGVVGAVRDTDVLSARLATRLSTLPDVDPVGAEHLRALLGRQDADARTAMLIALRSGRYIHLLDTLVALAAAPPFRKAAAKLTPRTSQRMASKIVQKPWRRVVDAVEALGPDPTDAPTARGAHSGQAVPLRGRSCRTPATSVRHALRLGGGGPADGAGGPSGHRSGRGVAPPLDGGQPRGMPDSKAAHRAGAGATDRPTGAVARHLAQGQRQEAPHLGLSPTRANTVTRPHLGQ